MFCTEQQHGVRVGPLIQEDAFNPEHTTCSLKLSFLQHEIHAIYYKIIIIIIHINLHTKNYTLVFSNNILEHDPQNKTNPLHTYTHIYMKEKFFKILYFWITDVIFYCNIVQNRCSSFKLHCCLGKINDFTAITQVVLIPLTTILLT